MSEKHHEPKPFSQTLENWLTNAKDKSLGGLIKVFEEKAFAIIFLLMMALPALPLPTGGVTHVTELITMLGALQMIIGRKTIWLPKRWLRLDAGKFMSGKTIKKFISVIRWFERYSRRRGGWLLNQTWMRSIIGLLIFIFTLAAFGAPPFSGLDTLPALGVVIISLAIILEDIVFLLLGIIVGAIGIGLEIATGKALYSGFKHFL